MAHGRQVDRELRRKHRKREEQLRAKRKAQKMAKRPEQPTTKAKKAG